MLATADAEACWLRQRMAEQEAEVTDLRLRVARRDQQVTSLWKALASTTEQMDRFRSMSNSMMLALRERDAELRTLRTPS